MIKIDNNSELKQRYSEIARFFTYAKFISLILIVLFILFAFYFYRDDITIENFRYMIKYLDFEAPDAAEAHGEASIAFDGEGAVSLALYRNDLAVLGRTEINLYDMAGQNIFSSKYTMSSPTVVCGDKYMLAFDLGGNYLAVFNTFSKIWETSFEYPIVDAAINDRGDFCVVTSEKGYTSAVYVYNRDFEKVYSWMSGDKYVVDVAMSQKHDDKFILSTLRAHNGFFSGEIILLSSDSKEAVASVTLHDCMALELSDFSDTVALLSDNSLSFFDANTLEAVSTVPFFRDSLNDFCYNEKYNVLVLSKKIIGSENELMVYNSDGTHLNTFTLQGHITDVCVTENELYVLLSGELAVFDLDTFEKRSLSVDKRYDELLSNKSAVILAGATDAVTVKGD
ncbi:MAG: hypothetical protein IJO52_11875 [Clostridia bacterium]|nr:hypothetical protein [Clostridia bacterium]